MSEKSFLEQTQIYRQMLAQLKEKYSASLEIFDATDIYCKEGICGPTENGRLLYWYTDHISDYAAGLVALRLNELLYRN